MNTDLLGKRIFIESEDGSHSDIYYSKELWDSLGDDDKYGVYLDLMESSKKFESPLLNTQLDAINKSVS